MNSREPSEATAARLRELFAQSREAVAAREQAVDELARATYEACEVEGASRRQVAKVVGVSPSTVQGWVDRARRLRNR
jgi:DNA-directed RNA polymerase specialized sigma24 family protein